MDITVLHYTFIQSNLQYVHLITWIQPKSFKNHTSCVKCQCPASFPDYMSSISLALIQRVFTAPVAKSSVRASLCVLTGKHAEKPYIMPR